MDVDLKDRHWQKLKKALGVDVVRHCNIGTSDGQLQCNTVTLQTNTREGLRFDRDLPYKALQADERDWVGPDQISSFNTVNGTIYIALKSCVISIRPSENHAKLTIHRQGRAAEVYTGDMPGPRL